MQSQLFKSYFKANFFSLSFHQYLNLMQTVEMEFFDVIMLQNVIKIKKVFKIIVGCCMIENKYFLKSNMQNKKTS